MNQKVSNAFRLDDDDDEDEDADAYEDYDQPAVASLRLEAGTDDQPAVAQALPNR